MPFGTNDEVVSDVQPFGANDEVVSGTPSNNISVQQVLAPRQEALPSNAGIFQTGAAMGGDALSFVGRAIAASPELRNGWQSYLNSMGKTRSESDNPFVSFIENTLRDPATVATLPIGGGVGSKVAGTGVKSLLKQIGKEALLGTAEGGVSAGVHQAENVASGNNIDFGQAALETTFGAGARGVAGGGGAALSKITGKNGVSTAKTIVSHLTQIPEDVLTRAAKPEELNTIKRAMVETGGDLERMGDDVLEMIGKIKVKAQDEMESGVMSARPGGAISPSDATGYNAGERIQNAAETAKQRTGDRFQTMQDITLDKSGAGQRPLPESEGLIKSGDYAPGNVLQQKVDEVFSEIGHDPSKGFTGLERLGNKAIGEPAIRQLQKAQDMFSNAKTTADALNMRRQIQKDISFGGQNGGPLFRKGSDEDMVMQRLYSKMNDVVEEQLRAQGKDAGITEDLVQLWKKNNEVWKNSHDALQSVQDGVKLGKANTEEYFGKIKDIGANDLKKISALAEKDPEIKPVWEELQNGFFDNTIKKSLKDGSIDITAFKKNWNSIEPEIKATMLSKGQIANVNKALQKVSDYGVDKPSDIGKNVTGLNGTQTAKRLENIGSKDKRQALSELQFLEDISGIPESDRFSNKAIDTYAGKQLNMTKEGKLPVLSGIKTGKFLAGAGAGASVGNSVAGPLGVIPGMFAGAYAQSPSGAVAMYKAVEKLGNVVSNPKVRKAAKTTGRIMTGPEVRAGARSNLFGNDNLFKNVASGNDNEQ